MSVGKIHETWLATWRARSSKATTLMVVNPKHAIQHDFLYGIGENDAKNVAYSLRMGILIPCVAKHLLRLVLSITPGNFLAECT